MAHPADEDDNSATWRLGGEGSSRDLVPMLLVMTEAGTDARPLPSTGSVVIGRAATCELRIEHAAISRRHARLTLSPALTIEDLGSANGVRVAGTLLAPGTPRGIAPGELVELGTVAISLQWRPRGAQRVDASAKRPAPTGPIIRDPVMVELFRVLPRVAASDISVLILGETGVGKEIVAEAVHLHSPRARGAFLRLNCGAIAPSLLESELFGHERGAFTGASREKPGLLESAHGGTVFLDEIGDLPIELQVKLLRVIEDRAVQRLGALRPRPIDVRFVAATHRDLRARIAAGSFREDLFFRLNGFAALVPPLRARPSDIEALARHFASRAKPSVVITDEALRALQAYPWPGNVRELRNVMERGVLLAGDEPVGLSCLPPELVQRAPAVLPSGAIARPADDARPPDRRVEIERELETLERERILTALERCGGNQTRAALELGMPRRTLVRWLSEHGVRRTRPRTTE